MISLRGGPIGPSSVPPRDALNGQTTPAPIAFGNNPEMPCDRLCTFNRGANIFAWKQYIYHFEGVFNASTGNFRVDSYVYPGFKFDNGTCVLDPPITEHLFPTNQDGVNICLSGPLSNTNGIIMVGGMSFNYGDYRSIGAHQIQANANHIVRLVDEEGSLTLRFTNNPPQLGEMDVIEERPVALPDLKLNPDQLGVKALFSSGNKSHVLITNQFFSNDATDAAVVTIDHDSMVATKTVSIGDDLLNPEWPIKIDVRGSRALIVYKTEHGMTYQWLDSTGLKDEVSVQMNCRIIDSCLFPCIQKNAIRFLHTSPDGQIKLVSYDLDTNDFRDLWESKSAESKLINVMYKSEKYYLLTKSNDVYTLTIVADQNTSNGGDIETGQANAWSINLTARLNLESKDPNHKTIYMHLKGIAHDGHVIIGAGFHEDDPHPGDFAFHPCLKDVKPFGLQGNESKPVNHSSTSIATTAPDVTIVSSSPPTLPPGTTKSGIVPATPPPASESHTDGPQNEAASVSTIGLIIGASVGGFLGAGLLLLVLRNKKRIRDTVIIAFNKLNRLTTQELVV